MHWYEHASPCIRGRNLHCRGGLFYHDVCVWMQSATYSFVMQQKATIAGFNAIASIYDDATYWEASISGILGYLSFLCFNVQAVWKTLWAEGFVELSCFSSFELLLLIPPRKIVATLLKYHCSKSRSDCAMLCYLRVGCCLLTEARFKDGVCGVTFLASTRVFQVVKCQEKSFVLLLHTFNLWFSLISHDCSFETFAFDKAPHPGRKPKVRHVRQSVRQSVNHSVTRFGGKLWIGIPSSRCCVSLTSLPPRMATGGSHIDQLSSFSTFLLARTCCGVYTAGLCAERMMVHPFNTTINSKVWRIRRYLRTSKPTHVRGVDFPTEQK